MALLVHHNFPDEAANGVAVTANPFDPSGLEPGFYVNVQQGGDAEVVAPPPGVTSDEFYDPRLFAITPMGFCFPGQDAKGSDLPPRRECVATWHDQLFAALPAFELILAVGRPAQLYHFRRLGLGHLLKPSLTETVAEWRVARHASGARVYPLPHPSWRNTGWIKRNPYFEQELLPQLRADIARVLG